MALSTSGAIGESLPRPQRNVLSAGTLCWLTCLTESDSVNARTLVDSQVTVIDGAGMTVQRCTQGCLAGGYTLAGVEYGNECCMSYMINLTMSTNQGHLLSRRLWQCFLEWW